MSTTNKFSRLPAEAPLTDHIALSLGRMMMRFSSLEAMMRFVLLRVMDWDPDEDPAIEGIVSGLPFRKLRESLLGACYAKLGDCEGFQALKGLSKTIGQIEEQRNTLTHSSWNYSQLPRAMTREKHGVARGGQFRTHAEAFHDAAVLDDFVVRIDACVSDLSRWYVGEFLGVRSMIDEPRSNEC